jgi:hypothetical protein
MPSYSPWGPPGAPSGPNVRASELRALQQLRTGAIIALVVALLSLAGSVSLGLLGGSSVISGISASSSSGSTNTTINVNAGAIWAIVAVIGASAAVQILGLYFYREAFVALRANDRSFSTPASLTIVLMVGLILLIPAFVLIFHALVAANGCVLSSATTGTNAPPCVGQFISSILAGVGLLLLAGILLLIGVIGFLIGIWRVGSHFNNSIFKVAAILFIIPFLSIISAILIYVSARNVETELQRRPEYPVSMPPAVPVWPPR